MSNVKFSILIVDDQPVNLKVAERIIIATGHHPEICGSGPEALELLRSKRYDLVLLDCLMPDMNGYQTAQRIRLRAENDRIPVIALSSLVGDAHWDECIKAGMDDVIAKPLQPESLRKLFKKFFKVDLSWTSAMLEKLAGLDFVSDKILTDLAAKDHFKAPSLDRFIDSYISSSNSVVQGLIMSIRGEDVLSILDFSRRLKILAQDIGSVRLTVLLQSINESLVESNLDHSEFWIERIQFEQNSLIDCLLRSWHSEIKIVHKPRLAVS